MRIEDRFRVEVPTARAWAMLTDLERIAPCMPGAELQEVDGDEYRGVVRARLGAMQAEYRGVARLREIDEEAGRLVLAAEGRELHGQGRATAVVTATVQQVDGGTEVSVVTDLNISGPVAQFGRGVLQSVSSRLLGDFAAALEQELGQADEADRGLSDDQGFTATAVVGGNGRAVAEPVDLLRLGGRSVLLRLVAAAAFVAAVFAVVRSWLAQ